MDPFWVIFLATYPAGFTFTARTLYGRWRYAQIEKGGSLPYCQIDHGTYARADCCAKRKENRTPEPDWWISVMACVAALVWPLAVFMGVITWKPPEHPKEAEARREKLDREIARLQAEADKARKSSENE